MKQVFIIHGGETYATYEQYLQDLKRKMVSLEPRTQGWKHTLQEHLGEGFEVMLPSMPCKQNAKYAEWKIWFEKYLPFLRHGVIFVGHSLGGIFLAKYLSENQLSVQVAGTLLVAAPFVDWDDESLADFVLGNTLELFVQQGGEIVIYHSSDDPVVPFSHARMYVDAVPEATLESFNHRGHFNDETFPELEDKIRELARKS